jgi:hypothetical protein
VLGRRHKQTVRRSRTTAPAVPRGAANTDRRLALTALRNSSWV